MLDKSHTVEWYNKPGAIWLHTTMYSLLKPLDLWLPALFLLMLFTFTSVSSSNLPLSSIDSWLKRFSPSSILRFTSTCRTIIEILKKKLEHKTYWIRTNMTLLLKTWYGAHVWNIDITNNIKKESPNWWNVNIYENVVLHFFLGKCAYHYITGKIAELHHFSD